MMVVIVATHTMMTIRVIILRITAIILLVMENAATFITLKCAILTKGIVVTTLELLMGSVMTQTITEFAIMMEETAALDLRILIAALCATALMSLM